MSVITVNLSNALVTALVLSCCLVAVLANSNSYKQQHEPTSLGQLMLGQLSPSDNNNKQQHNAKELKSASVSAKNSKQYYQDEQQKQLKEELKKKWHKLVDEIIENELHTSSATQTMVNQPILRRRQPVASQQQQQQSSSSGGDEKIMLVVKRKPALDLNTDGGSVPISPALIALNNFDNDNQKQPLSAGAQRPTINMMNHQRRILNDDFNIMKESIFTTNNHLGHKEVPKFGSDEQF